MSIWWRWLTLALVFDYDRLALSARRRLTSIPKPTPPRSPGQAQHVLRAASRAWCRSSQSQYPALKEAMERADNGDTSLSQ
jgi:hypothetical protein